MTGFRKSRSFSCESLEGLKGAVKIDRGALPLLEEFFIYQAFAAYEEHPVMNRVLNNISEGVCELCSTWTRHWSLEKSARAFCLVLTLQTPRLWLRWLQIGELRVVTTSPRAVGLIADEISNVNSMLKFFFVLRFWQYKRKEKVRHRLWSKWGEGSISYIRTLRFLF